MAGNWKKSSRSGGNQGNCVEIRLSMRVNLRDSKLGDASPIFTVTRANFAALVGVIKSGHLDG